MKQLLTRNTPQGTPYTTQQQIQNTKQTLEAYKATLHILIQTQDRDTNEKEIYK